MEQETAGPRRRPGATERSRRAILAGALSVFARDGYTRASMDAISATAGVSVRTVYNRFADKEALFRAVITDSAEQVADAEVALIEATLAHVTDVEEGLVAFGVAWASSKPEFADHFTLVRQINAEIAHIPSGTVREWQEAGPQRVTRVLAVRLEALADRGLLRIEDPERAAVHLGLLVTVANPSLRGLPVPDDELEPTVRAGVRTFLYGHAYLP